MIDWPLCVFLLGFGALALGFYVVQTSARRRVSLLDLDGRIARLERLLPDQGVPRALPVGLPQPRIGGKF